MLHMDAGGTIEGDGVKRPAPGSTVIRLVVPDELALANDVVLRAAINFACDVLAFATIEIQVGAPAQTVELRSGPGAATAYAPLPVPVPSATCMPRTR